MWQAVKEKVLDGIKSRDGETFVADMIDNLIKRHDNQL